MGIYIFLCFCFGEAVLTSTHIQCFEQKLSFFSMEVLIFTAQKISDQTCMGKFLFKPQYYYNIKAELKGVYNVWTCFLDG